MPDTPYPHIERAALAVSTGRTGTQYLAAYLSRHFPQVTALHQPTPYRHFRVCSNLYGAGKLSLSQMRRVWLLTRRRLLKGITTPFFVESNNYCYGFLEVFDSLFQEAIIIHQVRHPLEFIRSALNFGGYVGLKGFLLDYGPYWTIKPNAMNMGENLDWRRMSPFEKYAWIWTATNRVIEQSAQRCRQTLVLPFEGFFDGESSAMLEVCHALGLEANPESASRFAARKVNPSTSDAIPPWTNWDKDVLSKVTAICGSHAAEYGYQW